MRVLMAYGLWPSQASAKITHPHAKYNISNCVAIGYQMNHKL